MKLVNAENGDPLEISNEFVEKCFRPLILEIFREAYGNGYRYWHYRIGVFSVARASDWRGVDVFAWLYFGEREASAMFDSGFRFSEGVPAGILIDNYFCGVKLDISLLFDDETLKEIAREAELAGVEA